MSIFCGRFSAQDGCGLRLNRDEALSYMGYAGQQVDETLLTRFHMLADECESVLSARFVWGAFDIDFRRSIFEQSGATHADLDDARSCVALQDCELILPGYDIVRHLDGASKVVLMACTLGLESERELRKHAALGAVDGVMFGACSSALVEAAANAVETQVVAWAASQGLRTNWRYSPGYGDLPLSVQPTFLKALGATERIGLSATDTFMLVPQKSITAVVGLFEPGKGGDGVRGACATCQLRKCCTLREKGLTCHGQAARSERNLADE